jgi:hypothetical protein
VVISVSPDQVGHAGRTSTRFAWARRQPATAHRPRPTTPLISPIPNAVDPHLVAAALDSSAAIERGIVAFSATLTSPRDGGPIADAMVLFQVSLAARTTIKCQAITGVDGVARTESTLPAGLFDGGAVEYRVSYAGAPPSYWPVSVSGEIF